VTIEIGELLGKGGFGEVRRGTWSQNGNLLPAALKSIQSKSSDEELQKELHLLQQMNHLFIVKFLGCTVVESVK